MTPTSQACEHRWIWHLASDNRSPTVGICQDCGTPNHEHIAAWAEDRIKTATCVADAETERLRGVREATVAAIEDAVHALDIDDLAAYDVERIARVACAQFRTDEADRLRAELEKMRGKRDAWRAYAGRLSAGPADADPERDAEWLLRGERDEAQRQMRLALGSAASMAEQIIQRDLRLEVIARAETVALSERDQARALLVRALDLIDETSDYDYKAADAIRREAGLP